ncbi:MAG TPA: TonB-dependent receptor [Acetobacteraceae bacterium]|nr:TonB-dependent receptor [Acetobacteraceae bacterium]
MRPILLATLAGLAPALAHAQQPGPVVTLPPTVVTATRVPTPAERIPAAVTVLDRATIEERGYATLAEALAAIPGLRLVQTGGPGQQASAFLRGAAGRHVLVLLDGVPLHSPAEANGAFNFGQELLGDIERIEVVRGPTSAHYGSGALGGVINLITRRAPEGRVFAPFGEIAGGSNATARGVIGAAGRARGFDWMVAMQALSARGSNATAPRFFSNAGERDGFRGAAVTARIGYSHEATRIEGLIRWRENSFGLDDVPTDDPNYTGRDRSWMGFIRAETALLGGAWTTGLRLSASADRQRYVNPPDAGNVFSTTDDLYRGSRTTLEWSNTLRLAAMGFVADPVITFGALTERETANSFAGPAAFRTVTDAAIRSHAGYLGAQFRVFDRLDVTAGLRHDAPEGYEGATTWRIGGVLAVPEVASRLRASVGTGYKAPSLFQRFGVIGTFFRGNPDLRPEDSFSWEAGIETDIAPWATVSALYFDTRFRGLINFDPTFRTLENVDRARVRGAELGVAIRPAPWLSATGAWTITEARDEATGTPLPRRPRNVASLTLRIAPLPALVIAPEILFTGRSPEGAFARYADDGTALPARGYNRPGTVVNLGAQWRVSDGVALFLDGRNLTNSRYEPANGFVIPGRVLLVGTRVAL